MCAVGSVEPRTPYWRAVPLRNCGIPNAELVGFCARLFQPDSPIHSEYRASHWAPVHPYSEVASRCPNATLPAAPAGTAPPRYEIAEVSAAFDLPPMEVTKSHAGPA